jgi:hypothetical protein
MNAALQSFADWMNGSSIASLLLLALFVAATVPLVVLVHELGHAAVGLARTEGLVAIRVGRTPARWRARIGRLQLELNLVPTRNTPAGQARTYASRDTGTIVLSALAGPLAEALAGTAILFAGVRLHLVVVDIVGAFWIVHAARSLVPHTVNGSATDGANLLAALRSAGSGSDDPLDRALADTASRWLVQFSAASPSVLTERRMQLFGGALATLRLDPADRGPVAVGLWRLAYAGWCWREVERGEPARIREAVLDAVHTATVSGAVEPALTGRAAWALAAGPAELGLASPGGHDDERRRFFEAAFLRLPESVRLPSISVEHQRCAFRYGVALRDVERVRG